MGICRTSNGNVANFIQCGGSGMTDPITQFSIAGWVKITGAVPGDYGLVGGFIPDSGTVTDGVRFALRNFSGQKLELNTIKGAVSVGVASDVLPGPNAIANTWAFVGVTADSDANEVKFYYGLTPNTIAQYGSTQAFTGQMGASPNIRMFQIDHQQSAGAFKFPVTGSMDHWGFWIGEILTGDQMIAFANRCNVNVSRSTAYFIYTITGDSPEPSASLNLPPVAGVINGTLTVTEEATGCDLAGGTTILPNPPIARPPRISGGVGGGLEIPTLDFTDANPASVSPLESSARQLETPNFGPTLAKGPRGGLNSGRLSQKMASAFRSLDHLAAYTRRKKK